MISDPGLRVHTPAGACQNVSQSLGGTMSNRSATIARAACSISRRALVASAMFGLAPPSSDRPPGLIALHTRAADEVHRLLRPGQIALLTGPSGSGKSSILRALEVAAREQPLCSSRSVVLLSSLSHQTLISLTAFRDAPRRPIVDLFRVRLDAAMSLLARVGLAQASLFARCFPALSDGQKHRLLLALAFASAPPGATLLIDEFCSVLDRLSARAVAESVSRWLRPEKPAPPTSSQPPRLVVATAHEDLREHLEPDLHLHVPLDPDRTAPIRIERPPRLGDAHPGPGGGADKSPAHARETGDLDRPGASTPRRVRSAAGDAAPLEPSRREVSPGSRRRVLPRRSGC